MLLQINYDVVHTEGNLKGINIPSQYCTSDVETLRALRCDETRRAIKKSLTGQAYFICNVKAKAFPIMD